MRVLLFRWHQQVENGCAQIRCTDLSESENNSWQVAGANRMTCRPSVADQ